MNHSQFNLYNVQEVQQAMNFGVVKGLNRKKSQHALKLNLQKEHLDMKSQKNQLIMFRQNILIQPDQKHERLSQDQAITILEM